MAEILIRRGWGYGERRSEISTMLATNNIVPRRLTPRVRARLMGFERAANVPVQGHLRIRRPTIAGYDSAWWCRYLPR